jgi:hypothetical protein
LRGTNNLDLSLCSPTAITTNDNGTSQNYQKGNLEATIHFVEHMGAATSFFDIDHKQVLRFPVTKIKPEQINHDKKWITTWNDYLWL